MTNEYYLRLQDDQFPQEGTKYERRAQLDAILTAGLKIRALEAELEIAQKDAARAKHEVTMLSETVDELTDELDEVIGQDGKIKELQRANVVLRENMEKVARGWGELEADNKHLTKTVDALNEIVQADSELDDVHEKLLAEMECWERVAKTLMTQAELQAKLTEERDEARRQSNELGDRLIDELAWPDIAGGITVEDCNCGCGDGD